MGPNIDLAPLRDAIVPVAQSLSRRHFIHFELRQGAKVESFDGGDADNAIPRRAVVTLAMPAIMEKAKASMAAPRYQDVFEGARDVQFCL